MRYLNLSKQAKKFLARLAPKQFRQLDSKVQELCNNPLPNDTKALKGGNNDYRADQGEYRIIYRFDDTTLFVLIIDRRNDNEVYKKYLRSIKSILLSLAG